MTGFYNGKRAVVTGAGGFIGSHLVEALVREGAQVKALVRYTSTSSRGHLAGLSPDVAKNVAIDVGNVEDPVCVRELVRGADVVFHLAALIGIPYSYVAPYQYVATNITGTLNVLEAVRREGVGRMVHTSTSETYGTARYTPIDEAHPLQGQSPYSASKIGADKLAESYFLSFGVPVATIRPFNTFGPRQSARAFIPTVMAQLAAGKKALRLGSLTPVRDMNYVADTAAGFLAVGASDKCLGEVTNVGSGRAVSMADLVQTIFQVSGKTAEITSDEARVRPDGSEVMVLLANAQKAKERCGWEPRFSLEEGLSRAWDYVVNNLGAYRPDDYAV